MVVLSNKNEAQTQDNSKTPAITYKPSTCMQCLVSELDSCLTQQLHVSHVVGKILKSSYFWLYQKPGLLQSTLLTRISSPRLRCCSVDEEAGCCFLIGVVVPQNLAKGIVVLLFSSITQSKFVWGVQGSLVVCLVMWRSWFITCQVSQGPGVTCK